MECQNRSDKYIWSPHDAYFYKGLSEPDESPNDFGKNH